MIPIHYFGYPTFNNGKPNATHKILESILDGTYGAVRNDESTATWLSATGTIDINYFAAQNAEDGLARSQKVRGAFLNANPEKKHTNKWKIDFLIINTQEVEADLEKELPRFVRINGYFADSYNERLMGVQFQARAEKAMDYILGLSVSANEPYFVSTWGEIASVKRLVVRANVFGDSETDEYSSTQWLVTGMSPDAYQMDEEASAKYEEYLAALTEHMEAQKTKSAERKEKVDTDLPF